MSDEKKTRRRSIFLSNSDGQQEVSKPFKRGLGMKITIHRGTNQIGGCVTEYEHNGWHLFVDYGDELPGGPKTGELQVEGLTHGDLSKSALLITHYHGDHIGSITKLPEKLPIYMGEVAREIQLVLSNHLKTVFPAHKEMVKLLQNVQTFEPGKAFTFGPFNIRPVTVDHSAFDAYAFRIEADGVSAYHTGDFRLHGFRSSKFFKMLEQYVGKVDYVVCEATNILRPNTTSKKESALQRELESLFKEKKSTVVYLSSTNIDRLFSLYHAALKAGRPFYVDKYQKDIMDVVVNSQSMWTKSSLYQYGKCEPETLMYHQSDKNRFFVSDSFKEYLDKKGYVIIARSSERFDDLLEQIPGEKQKVLSMWNGYVKEGTDAYNENLANSLDGEYDYMHTSGHIDMKDLREFFHQLQPKAIIPIHTDSPDEFAKLFCDEWPIIRLYDGQSISPISASTADSCSARIFCTKVLEDGMVYENREEWEEAHGLDVKSIGAFKTIEDSKFALYHTLYRPAAIVGYEIEEEEDLSPFKIQTFDASKNLLATYTHGGHQPGGAKYQEVCRFAAGEKALAVFHAPYYAIVPVKVIGAITPDSEREYWEKNEFYDTYEDYVKDWDDWHWDSVVVHPLVKLKSKYEQMTDTEIVPRVYLFPYGNTDEWGV